MRIFIIEGSPHRQGSSNLLADNFIRGTEVSGHKVTVFDAAHANIHSCLGCDYCGMFGPCCQKDDMADVREMVLTSDMLVLVTPIYYFGMSAQLKAVIGRFYSFSGELTSMGLKTILIAAAWNNNNWTMQNIKSHYQTLCTYLNFKNQGMILGTGCGTVPMTKETVFPQMAYELGKNI
ncbi:MAG TPA: flavodoxin family protein [Mobilitalea sp.]|nr:flavodoxin family protein [Mobilitalea sp.]